MKKSLILLIGFLFIIQGCKKKGNELTASSEEVTNYLTSFTRGMIDANEPIQFQFNSDVQINQSKLKQAVKIEPTVGLDISFNQQLNTLVVKPQKKLELGKAYKVTVKLGQLLEQVNNTKVVSEVKVHSQYITVDRKGFIIDKNGDKYLEIAVNTSIPETNERILSMFDAKKENMSITRIGSYDHLVQIKYSKQKKIQWSAKTIQGTQSGTINFFKELDGFKVVSIDFNKSNNILTAYFSQIINKKQDKTGLVLVGNQNAKYDIEGNKIKVYIQNRLKEDEGITIKKGLKSNQNKQLEEDVEYDVELAVIEPKVEWLSDGTYISESGKFKVPFKAIGLTAVHVSVAAFKGERAAQFASWNDISNLSKYELVRYGDFVYDEIIQLEKSGIDLREWNEFGLDLSKAFKRQSGYIYRVYLNFIPSHTILNCKSSELQEVEVEMMKKDWFNKKRNYQYYDYDYDDIDNPCTPSYYTYNDAIAKNIHCTNVFPIMKQGEQTLTVALKELLKTSIAKNAQVEVLNLQGKVIDSKKIGSSAIASFEHLAAEPKAIRVHYGGVTSYFSMQDGYENSITEFDVSSGVESVENKLFVYSERDVRRPGDNIYLNIMLNEADFDYPAGLPIKIKLYNPKNVVVATQKQAIAENQYIYSFKFPTNIEDPTGNWKAEIQLGATKINKTIRVETIKPNQVDAVYSFKHQTRNVIYANQLQGTVQVDYLAGYPMKNGTLKATGNIYPITTPFKEFNEYRFKDYVTESTKGAELFEKTTNKHGQTSFNISYDFVDKNAMCTITLDTEIELPGGGTNTQTSYYKVSPFKTYIGIKNAKGSGWRGSYRYGETPKLKIVNVNQDGKLQPGNRSATATLYLAKEDWWYDRYRLADNTDVQSSSYFKEVKTFPISFANGKATYTHNESESGLYILQVKDNTSGHLSEMRFHSVTNRNYSVENNPVFFEINTEKDNYKVGEKMVVKLPKLKDAQAFISVEKGDKVLQSFWMNLNTPTLELQIDENFYPNFYLNVNIVQNYGQKNNDRPLRMYGIKKVKVNERKSILKPQIKVAEKVHPNEKFNIKIAEENGQPMEYTLAVVDRGLLNLTGYQTPNPIQHFSRQYSLFVKTWDIYDELIYYMNPAFAGVFSIGGDGINKKLDEAADFNRFEPVIYHYGPFQLPKGKTQNHEIELPNYIGSLRVMVVATNKETFGSAEKNVRVASPLMLQSQLPRALNVSDKVTLPVTLFKDEEGIKSANISASSVNNAVTFQNGTQTINFSNENQSLATMQMLVGDKAGKTTIDLNAKSGTFKANETTDIFVNYPNSYESKTTYIELPANGEQTIDVTSFGYKETQNVDISIAGVMLPSFTEMHQSLLDYPYGCLEQTTSQGFSLLYLPTLTQLSAEQEKQADDHIDEVFKKYTRFQNSDGSFKYWENGYYHEWANLYAGNYLIDAKELGKEISNSMLENWIDFNTQQANKWSVKGVNLRVQKQEEVIQAYRLYLLAKSNQPTKSAMNRMMNAGITSPFAKMVLAGAYKYTGMDTIANNLFNDGFTNFTPTDYNYATFGSSIRNKAIILHLLKLIGKDEQSISRYYNEFIIELNSKSWLSTQEKGFAMMACNSYLAGRKGGNEVSFKMNSKAHTKQVTLASNQSANFHWSSNQLNDNLTVKNLSNETIYIIKTQRGISTDLYKGTTAEHLSIQVNYTNLEGSPISADNIQQGQDIIINVNVRNTDIIDHNSLALTVKMPSGWELINPRLLETAKLKNDAFNYQDYRDDKVYTFFKLDNNELKRFKFRAKANLKGDFYQPAITCEHMYQGNVKANTKARRVLVK